MVILDYELFMLCVSVLHIKSMISIKQLKYFLVLIGTLILWVFKISALHSGSENWV
jgi:hypothetical protein